MSEIEHSLEIIQKKHQSLLTKMWLDEHCEVLAGFKPAKIKNGRTISPLFGQIADPRQLVLEVADRILQREKALIINMGSPGGGKSTGSEQITAAVEKVLGREVRSGRIEWGNMIERIYGQKLISSGKGRLELGEFPLVSAFMAGQAKGLMESCGVDMVFVNTSGLTAAPLESEHLPRVKDSFLSYKIAPGWYGKDRGVSTVMILNNHGFEPFILGEIPDSAQQNATLTFRRSLWRAFEYNDFQTVAEIFNRYNVIYPDGELWQVASQIVHSSAPAEAVEAVIRDENTVLYYLDKSDALRLPDHSYKIPSPESLSRHPRLRRMGLAAHTSRAIEHLGVPAEKVGIFFNNRRHIKKIHRS